MEQQNPNNNNQSTWEMNYRQYPTGTNAFYQRDPQDVYLKNNNVN